MHNNILNIFLYSVFNGSVWRTVPSKPLNLTVLEVTSTTITIGWRNPENMNGAIVGYRVFYIHQNQTYFATLRSGTEAGEQITYVLSDLSKCFVLTLFVCNVSVCVCVCYAARNESIHIRSERENVIQYYLADIQHLIHLFCLPCPPPHAHFAPVYDADHRTILRVQDFGESVHLEKRRRSIRVGHTAHRH